ncbi:MAG: glutaredoxin domain-containing protein [Parcubacteria group bacterium]
MTNTNKASNGAKKVAIYTTPACGYCKMAKEYFKENNIKYEEYDVAVDAEKRQEMFDNTHQMGVPVIQIGDQYVIGFDKVMIEKLLSGDMTEKIPN